MESFFFRNRQNHYDLAATENTQYKKTRIFYEQTI